MEMQANTSRVGAAFLAQRSDVNFRKILVELLQENPQHGSDVVAHKRSVFPLFEQIVMDDADKIRAAIWYLFVNFYDYEMTTRNVKPGAVDRATRMASNQQMKDRVKEEILGRVVRMELVMPNGKLLRDCTFGYMAQLSGWFGRLAKKGKPNQVVGKVLTEADLQKIR